MVQQQPNSTSAVEAAAIRERFVQAKRAAEKRPRLFVIPSEARNLSFFLLDSNQREIPRFARNDKIKCLFRGL
jgi:hypothetical protein